jgi:hypothetical protein
LRAGLLEQHGVLTDEGAEVLYGAYISQQQNKHERSRAMFGHAFFSRSLILFKALSWPVVELEAA